MVRRSGRSRRRVGERLAAYLGMPAANTPAVAGSGRPITPERRRRLRLPSHLVDDAEDAEDFLAVPDHVAVAGLAPAQQAVAVDDEGRAVGDVPLHVVDAVGLDDLAVDIAQEREWEAPGLGKGVVGERAIAADREKRDPATFELAGDLSQAGQLGRSDTAPVVAVEREDHVGLAPVFGEGDGAAERRGQREFRARAGST